MIPGDNQYHVQWIQKPLPEEADEGVREVWCFDRYDEREDAMAKAEALQKNEGVRWVRVHYRPPNLPVMEWVRERNPC